MNGKCFEIGTIQAFLDGETEPELTTRMTDHIAACDGCAVRLAESDEENSIVFSALDREFNSLVPTQRLWTRINETIAVEKSRLSPWRRIIAAFPAFQLSSPTFAAIAGVVMLVSIFALVNGLRNRGEVDQIAAIPQLRTERPATREIGPAPEVDSGTLDISAAAPSPSTEPSAAQAGVKESRIPASKIRNAVINADFVEPRRIPVRSANVIEAAYLPGENSYVKTISDLKQSVDGQKDRILSPSSRISFERDMAVVNDSIKRMQSVIRKNPRNQAAKQVLYSAYQDKIDLLNSVAQKEELLVSLR